MLTVEFLEEGQHIVDFEEVMFVFTGELFGMLHKCSSQAVFVNGESFQALF